MTRTAERQVGAGDGIPDDGHWCHYLPPAEPPRGTRKLEAQFRLLQLVRKRTLVTVPDASRTTRRQEDTITRGVNELRTIGLLEPDSESRAEVHFRLTATAGWSIGVAFERDRVVALPFDLSYRTPALEDVVEAPVDVDRDPDAALEAAASAIARIVEQDKMQGDLLGAGLAIPAPIDVEGMCRTRIAGAWYGRHPAEDVRERLEDILPSSAPRVLVAAENDASLGGLGIYLRRFQVHANVARVPRDLLYVRVADGVGVGLFSKGKFVRGGHGMAGEVGHSLVKTDERRECPRCGRPCLETVCSTGAIERRVSWSLGRQVAIRELIDDYDQLDALTRTILRLEVYRAGRHLGDVLADVCAWADPTLIVLGGPLARNEQLGRALREAVDASIVLRGLPYFEADELCRVVTEVIRPEATIPLPEMRGAAGMVVQRHADAWLWWELEQHAQGSD